MSTSNEFQMALDQLGTDIGEETQTLYDQSFGSDWPDEESTTGALLGAVAISAQRLAERLHGGEGISLKAKLSKKRDEAQHGADALIRFWCKEPEWKISSSTLIQAKRYDRGSRLRTSDHQRLSEQLQKMLRFTPESFVILYTQNEGVQLVPALAASALGPAELLDLSVIAWPSFLSGIFRGQIGEPVAERTPYGKEGWQPEWVLDLQAVATRAAPLRVRAIARG